MAPPLVTVAPVLVDATTFAASSKISYGHSPSTVSCSGPSQAGLRPFLFKHPSGLFAILQNAIPQNQQTGVGGAFQSPDGGVTWNRLDATHQPAFGRNLTCFYPASGGDTVYVAYADTDTGLSAHIVINSFNFLTGLWGTAHTSTIAYNRITNGGFHITGLSNGDLYVYYCDGITTSGRITTKYTKFSGGVFGAAVLVAPQANNTAQNPLTVITDSLDRTHVLYSSSNCGPSGAITFFYVQVDSTGAVGSPSDLSSLKAHTGDDISTGCPAILGDTLFVPCFFGPSQVSTLMQCLVGVGLAAPAWSLTTVDPGSSTCPSPAQLSSGTMPAVVDTFARAWVFWVVVNASGDTSPQQIWAANFLSSSSTWSAPILVYDYALLQPGTVPLGSGLGQYINGVCVIQGSFVLHAQMPFSLAQEVAGFSMLAPVPAPPAPPAVTIQKATVGGGVYFPRYLNKTLLLAQVARLYGPLPTGNALLRDFPPLSSFFLFPNIFDLCLSREFELHNLIDRQAMSCARKPDCFLEKERDWKDYPSGWITFNPVKSIPLPAPGDGDVVIFSLRVPYGFDGIITAQYHGYTQGFTEGSGDIFWRVRADKRYLRDCGNMALTIGSPKQLSPIYGGLQLRSGNLVEYVVNAPNTSGLLPPPGTGNILAGLHGIFYPRT